MSQTVRKTALILTSTMFASDDLGFYPLLLVTRTYWQLYLPISFMSDRSAMRYASHITEGQVDRCHWVPWPHFLMRFLYGRASLSASQARREQLVSKGMAVVERVAISACRK